MKAFEEYCSDIQYAVSIKDDTAYMCLHFTKDHKGTRSNMSYPEKTNTPYSSYGNKIFWTISNVVPTSRNPRYAILTSGEFEKLESVKISDVSLTCNTSLEIFNEEFNRMSRMEDDLFRCEVEITEVTIIPRDLKREDNSEQQVSHEFDDDLEYDPSDTRGDDEVELTNEESSDSDDEDKVAKKFRIETNVIKFEKPLCRTGER
nr:hypothetical protein [Tanacetum cinerariifolium]